MVGVATIAFTDGRVAEAIPESITTAGIPGDYPGEVAYKLVYRTPGLSMWFVPLDSVLSIVFRMERPKRTRRRRKLFTKVTPKQVPMRQLTGSPEPS